MTTAPVVELRFNPTDLRPRDLPIAGAFLGSPSDAIEAGLAMARARMREQLKSEVRGIAEPTSAQILRLADLAWGLFLPSYKKISAPVMADAYIRAYRAANAGDVPMSVIYDLADKHAEKVGDYFHESSRDALADGFNTMVNRRIPAKAAADRVLDAYGLTPRQMRGYTSNKAFNAPVESVSPLDVKGRARNYVDRAFTTRVRKLSAQEEHNIDEQAKQFAWMWLQDKGRLSAKAQKMWITAKDERVCKVCGPLHGKKVLVGNQFKTKEGAFWSPGLHPNCRCVVRLIENKFTLEKRFDPHQPRGADGRWGGGQSKTRQLAHKVNALESPSAKVLQGEVVHRSAQAAGYLTQPRYLTTPLKHRDREMAQLARGASAWSRRGANVQRARKMAEGDNAYYAGKLSRTEKGLHKLITAVESAPANSPELYRGLVVSPEHLNELKEGSAFTLPMSSFTESQPFSESFARKWGPMIAHAHAKREGKEAPGDMHPVVMVLESKANALNISPLVSERQAEWITRGEFLITQVGDDNGLTVVHLKQTSNRISKADWDAKEHPRGGDPENKGRFSRRVKTLEAEKEKPLTLLESTIWDSLKTEAEPETKVGTETEGKLAMGATAPEGKLSMGSTQKLRMGGLAMGRIAMGNAAPEGQLAMGAQTEGELSMGNEDPKKLKMGRSEAKAKLAMMTTPAMKMEMTRTLESMTMAMPDYVPPKPRRLEVIDRPVLRIQDDNGHEYPVYAVVKPGDLNWSGGKVELNHQVKFTPSKNSLRDQANEAFEDQIVDATDMIYEEDMPNKWVEGHKWSLDPSEDDILEVVNWAAYQGRVVDKDSQPNYDKEIDWVDRGGARHTETFRMSELAKMLGVNPKHFDVRIMRMDEGHDSREGTTHMDEAGTRYGYEKWVTSGRYHANPVASEEINHNLAINVFWIDPDVKETTIGWTGVGD